VRFWFHFSRVCIALDNCFLKYVFFFQQGKLRSARIYPFGGVSRIVRGRPYWFISHCGPRRVAGSEVLPSAWHQCNNWLLNSCQTKGNASREAFPCTHLLPSARLERSQVYRSSKKECLAVFQLQYAAYAMKVSIDLKMILAVLFLPSGQSKKNKTNLFQHTCCYCTSASYMM